VRRDSSIFPKALGASLLLHLVLLLLVLPGVRDAWSRVDAAALEAMRAEVVPEPTRPPLEFEFVDLANDVEADPDRADAPLSDLDRRAAGGEGETSDRAASQGNTPQKVQAEGADAFGAGAPPQQPAPREVPMPETRPERESEPRPVQTPRPRPDEGAGEEQEQVEEPQPEPQQPALRLPPTGAWTLPPEVGGMTENPDTLGGQVDSGGLSFDTQWYDWGPYAKNMLAKIRRNWRIPDIARLGVQGVVRIRFFIEKDGTITGLQILDESGKPPMDFAARDAISRSDPFDPLPEDLLGVDREGVTITFLYNIRRDDPRYR